MKKLIVTLLLSALITGCGTMNPRDFENSAQQLDLFEYFAGETRAWGIFEDRFNRLRRQFTVDIYGRVNGDTLVLEEYFTYADGERQERTWTIRRLGEHRYSGTAGDVIGEASGETYGNALHWNYQLDLKVGDRNVKVAFDDWMFLQPDGVLMNRARIKKFGIGLGTVTLAFMKSWPGKTAAAAASR